MLRYFGVICIFIFAFYVIFAYEKQQKRSLSQGEEALLLLKFFLDELQSLARAPRECIRSFRAAALEKTPLLDAIAEGKPPRAALLESKEKLCLPRGMEKILEDVFENFGRGGRREECRRLCEAIERAEALLSSERQEHTRRLTLCRTLTTASAMGLVILLM